MAKMDPSAADILKDMLVSDAPSTDGCMVRHNHIMPTRKVSLGVVVATGSGSVITIPPTSSS